MSPEKIPADKRTRAELRDEIAAASRNIERARAESTERVDQFRRAAKVCDDLAAELRTENDILREALHALELEHAHLRGRLAEIEDHEPPAMIPAPREISQYARPLTRRYGLDPSSPLASTPATIWYLRNGGRR